METTLPVKIACPDPSLASAHFKPFFAIVKGIPFGVAASADETKSAAKVGPTKIGSTRIALRVLMPSSCLIKRG